MLALRARPAGSWACRCGDDAVSDGTGDFLLEARGVKKYFPVRRGLLFGSSDEDAGQPADGGEPRRGQKPRHIGSQSRPLRVETATPRETVGMDDPRPALAEGTELEVGGRRCDRTVDGFNVDERGRAGSQARPDARGTRGRAASPARAGPGTQWLGLTRPP